MCVKLEASFPCMILTHIFIFSLHVHIFINYILGRFYINDTIMNFLFATYLFIQHYVSEICPDWQFILFNCCILSHCVTIPTEGWFG